MLEQAKQKLGPFLEFAEKNVPKIIETVGPIAAKLWVHALVVYQILSQRTVHVQLVVGLLFLVWGGNFILTVAALEAFRVVGYEQLKKHIAHLYESFLKAKSAYVKDLSEKKKKDSSSSSEEATVLLPKKEEQLLTFVAKLANVAQAVDPELVTRSAAALGAGLLAVIATLQSKLAQVLVLGTSFADVLVKPLLAHSSELLTNSLPKEYHKWVIPALSFLSKAVGIMIAFFLQRWILIMNLCFQSTKWIIDALITLNLVPPEFHDKLQHTYYPLAIMGLIKQLLWGFDLPFLLYLPLLPLLVFEWLCSLLVLA